MRILLFSALVIIAFAQTINPLRAQQSDIVGTWSGEITLLLKVNDEILEVPRQWSLVIEKADKSLIRGYHQWKAVTDDPGNVAGESVLVATEPIIGAVDTDGVTLRFVETADSGILFAELLAPDKLEATYMETHPHAVIFTTVLRRETN